MADSDGLKSTSSDIPSTTDFASTDIVLFTKDPGGTPQSYKGEWGDALAKHLVTAAGDMLYASAASVLAVLATSTTDKYLSPDSDGLPSWVDLDISRDTTPDLGGNLNMSDHQAYGSLQAITYATDITIDLDAGIFCTLTLTNSPTTIGFTNIQAAATYAVQLTQDGTGGRTITWDTEVTWPGGVAPTLTTDAGAVDIIVFVAFDSDTLRGTSQLAYS